MNPRETLPPVSQTQSGLRFETLATAEVDDGLLAEVVALYDRAFGSWPHLPCGCPPIDHLRWKISSPASLPRRHPYRPVLLRAGFFDIRGRGGIRYRAADASPSDLAVLGRADLRFHFTIGDTDLV